MHNHYLECVTNQEVQQVRRDLRQEYMDRLFRLAKDPQTPEELRAGFRAAALLLYDGEL
jgi:hypothetical protein